MRLDLNQFFFKRLLLPFIFSKPGEGDALTYAYIADCFEAFEVEASVQVHLCFE